MSADSSSIKAGEALIINDEEVRMVMLGKTGAGKSATGNTILGHKAFESKFAGTSLTKNCQKVRSVVAGRNVSVIDTPGLFDTELTTEENLEEIKLCISFAAPGPHVFLGVIKLGRFTEEEQKSVEMIQEVFGPMSNKYTMILFTNSDQLEEESVEDIVKDTPKLQELVRKCEGGYHVFNNKTKDPSQVTELLVKINNMVLKNGGSHYTTEMFQEAEKEIEEKKQIILKENEEMISKEEEELKTKYEGEALAQAIHMLKEQREKEARKQAETSNAFLAFRLITTIGSLYGCFNGAAIGLFFGPRTARVGGAIGRVVGGAVGAAVGIAHAAGVKFEYLEDKDLDLEDEKVIMEVEASTKEFIAGNFTFETMYNVLDK